MIASSVWVGFDLGILGRNVGVLVQCDLVFQPLWFYVMFGAVSMRMYTGGKEAFS